MKLEFLEAEYSVCQLPPESALPTWADGFLSISRTDDELTIISPSTHVPEDAKAQRDFRCFRIASQLDFDVIGVIASISAIMAEEKIPILSISTYNTDYFLIPGKHRERAHRSLTKSGYRFVE